MFYDSLSKNAEARTSVNNRFLHGYSSPDDQCTGEGQGGEPDLQSLVTHVLNLILIELLRSEVNPV